jgi:phosphate transport system protein
MLEQKITELKEKLFTMASLVESMLEKSVSSLVNRDEELAREVIDKDEPKANDLEIEIEDSGVKLIALHQPEASFLRVVIAMTKINNDLERIGDHAVNIAERALFLIPRPLVKPLIDLPRMGKTTRKMLKESLDSFARKDANLAISVCKEDEEVDSLRDQIVRELITYMISDPSTIERSIQLISIARNLERVADLATNIAEDVVFTVKGEVIKHHREEKKKKKK